MIEARDVKHTIYEMPLMLNEEGLDDLICELLHIEAPPPNLTNWRKFVERVVSPKKQVKIAVVGKYIDLQDAYKSIYESLTHAAASQDCGIELQLIDAETLEGGIDGHLKDVAGVLIPGGFGERGVEGKISAARFARENRVPYLGLCLGMQVRSSSLKRFGLESQQQEFDEKAPPVICRSRSTHVNQGSEYASRHVADEDRKGNGGGEDLRRRRGARASPPSLRVQHEVPREDG